MTARGLGLRLSIAATTIGAGFLAVRPSAGGYRGFRQARFAPPPWAFGPAWTLIELAGADSVARVIEADDAEGGPRRGALFAAVANDALYVAFPIVYFRLRSPVLAAAVTWAQLGAVVIQALESRKVDEAAGRGLYPQIAWLLYAGPLGTVQALANNDPLLGTKALRPKLGRPRDCDV